MALAACSISLQAQKANPRHEISASVYGTNIVSMPFSGDLSWEAQNGTSHGIGLDYTYWFNKHVGLQAGLRANKMNHQQNMGNIDLNFSGILPLSSIGIVGGTGNTTVNLNGKAKACTEKQEFTYVELPIRLALKGKFLYGNFGVSVAKAVSGKSEYNYDNVEYAVLALPDLGVTMPSPVPVTFAGKTSNTIKGDDMYKPLFCLLGGEVGFRFNLCKAFAIGVGVYGKYALPQMKSSQDNEVFPLQGTIIDLSQPSTTPLVDNIGYYEAGLRLTAFLGSKKSCTKEDNVDDNVLTPNNSEAERLAAEKAEAERLAAEKAARERAEAERLAAEKAARERAEAERVARERAEAERIAAENAARERTAAEEAAIARDAEAARLAAEAAAAKASMAELKANVEMLNILFDFRSAELKLSSSDKAVLQALATAMKADKNIKAVITGHADNYGTPETNINYGIMRAEAVKSYLVKQGVRGANIECQSKGETEPVADNDTEEGRAKNRRATVTVQL